MTINEVSLKELYSHLSFNDVVECAQQLIAFKSETPSSGGALAFIESILVPVGFEPFWFSEGGVENLYLKYGQDSPHFCFAGHVDVVPAGDDWSTDPFLGTIKNEKLYGRGVSDMKGAIACFLCALLLFIHKSGGGFKSTISLVLTSDEEGVALFGTKYVVEQLQKRGESIDLALIGEPTSQHRIADTIKVGRRGSLNVDVCVKGKSGHVAYPHLAHNPIPPLISFLQRLLFTPFDAGNKDFQPTNLEIIGVCCNNVASNVIPSKASANFNIRFTPFYTGDSLQEKIEALVDEFKKTYGGRYEWVLTFSLSGNSFYCDNEKWRLLLKDIVKEQLGYEPSFNTLGGTSDGRFLKDMCPVLELGLQNATAHHVDEHVFVEDLEKLKHIYLKLLSKMFV